jgi:hypothetical protein
MSQKVTFTFAASALFRWHDTLPSILNFSDGKFSSTTITPKIIENRLFVDKIIIYSLGPQTKNGRFSITRHASINRFSAISISRDLRVAAHGIIVQAVPLKIIQILA